MVLLYYLLPHLQDSDLFVELLLAHCGRGSFLGFGRSEGRQRLSQFLFWGGWWDFVDFVPFGFEIV